MPKFSKEKKCMLDKLMQEKICQAAAEAIVKYGIKNTTVSKVAEEAGIAKGTIYNYFKNKNELIASLFDYVLEPVVSKVVKISNSELDPLEKLQGIARALLEAFTTYKKLFILIHEAKISGLIANQQPFEKREKFISIVEKIVIDASAKKLFKPFSARVITEIFLGMIMSINISKMTKNTDRPVEEDLDTIITIFSQGVLQENCKPETYTNE
jgi:AcrR family transcriptional regulator